MIISTLQLCRKMVHVEQTPLMKWKYEGSSLTASKWLSVPLQLVLITGYIDDTEL